MSWLSVLIDTPREAAQVIDLFKALTNGSIVTALRNDPPVAALISQVEADIALLESDVAAFKHAGIFSVFGDAIKFAKDAASIGFNLIAAYSSISVLAADPVITSLVGTLLTVVNDLAGFLHLFGISLPIPAPAAAVIATKAAQPIAPLPTPVAVPVTDSGTVDGNSLDDPSGFGGNGGGALI